MARSGKPATALGMRSGKSFGRRPPKETTVSAVRQFRGARRVYLNPQNM